MLRSALALAVLLAFAAVVPALADAVPCPHASALGTHSTIIAESAAEVQPIVMQPIVAQPIVAQPIVAQQIFAQSGSAGTAMGIDTGDASTPDFSPSHVAMALPPVSATRSPEQADLLLLGTGVLGAAGALRRTARS